MIKLPRHVYSPNSEASVSNDGKILDFCKFLFLSSVIKFDNEMSEVKTKPITIAQLLFMQSQNLLSKTRTTLFITRQFHHFGNSSYFIIHLRHKFSLILGVILLKLKHASNRPVNPSPISHFNLKLENSIHTTAENKGRKYHRILFQRKFY